MIATGSRMLPDSFSGRGCSRLRLRLCWCNSDTSVNIAFHIVLNTASRTKKGVLTAVEAETCARPNLGTLMVAGAILAALLQVVQITRKWRELRAVSSYVFLEGWRSAFGAQSNAKRTTCSHDDMGSNIHQYST
jgi:hypothetical protein